MSFWHIPWKCTSVYSAPDPPGTLWPRSPGPLSLPMTPTKDPRTLWSQSLTQTFWRTHWVCLYDIKFCCLGGTQLPQWVSTQNPIEKFCKSLMLQMLRHIRKQKSKRFPAISFIPMRTRTVIFIAVKPWDWLFLKLRCQFSPLIKGDNRKVSSLKPHIMDFLFLKYYGQYLNIFFTQFLP